MTYQTMTCQVCLGFGQVDIFALSIILHRVCTSSPSPPPKLAVFDVFKIKALGNMQFSQEHLKTTVYAIFGDQGGCIMGDSKVENWSSLSLPRRRMQLNLMRDCPFRRK